MCDCEAILEKKIFKYKDQFAIQSKKVPVPQEPVPNVGEEDIHRVQSLFYYLLCCCYRMIDQAYQQYDVGE